MSTECSTLTVRVAAPSRLHFGLLSVGPASQPQFGGVGAMIDQPGLELIIRPSDQFQVVGQHAERVRRVANHVLESYPLEAGLRCCIEVTRAADHHVGLGTGTQLALSVTAGLLRYVGASDLTAVQLASLAGRARRSSIGTHGFLRGGLLYEEQKSDEQVLAPLISRVALPDQWRWLLVYSDGYGLHGQDEKVAFELLPRVSEEVVAKLRSEINEQLLPAARVGDYQWFSESVHRYGLAAGSYFASQQSAGSFTTARTADVVEQLRKLGVCGVGQTSWGPTVFALCREDSHANEIQRRMASDAANSDLRFAIAAPNNTGAKIERHETSL